MESFSFSALISSCTSPIISLCSNLMAASISSLPFTVFCRASISSFVSLSSSWDALFSSATTLSFTWIIPSKTSCFSCAFCTVSACVASSMESFSFLYVIFSWSCVISSSVFFSNASYSALNSTIISSSCTTLWDKESIFSFVFSSKALNVCFISLISLFLSLMISSLKSSFSFSSMISWLSCTISSWVCFSSVLCLDSNVTIASSFCAIVFSNINIFFVTSSITSSCINSRLLKDSIFSCIVFSKERLPFSNSAISLVLVSISSSCTVNCAIAFLDVSYVFSKYSILSSCSSTLCSNTETLLDNLLLLLSKNTKTIASKKTKINTIISVSTSIPFLLLLAN